MSLVEKLQQRAKALDDAVRYSAVDSDGGYEFEAADDRELLEAAAKRIRELEHSLWLI